jgi:hypothetical protein
MEVVERFQGAGGDAPGESNSAVNRMMQKSKDRLAEKRQREEEPMPPPMPQAKPKQARPVPQSIRTKGNAAEYLRRQRLAEESPTDKKARKTALKMARNERRDAAAAAPVTTTTATATTDTATTATATTATATPTATTTAENQMDVEDSGPVHKKKCSTTVRAAEVKPEVKLPIAEPLKSKKKIEKVVAPAPVAKEVESSESESGGDEEELEEDEAAPCVAAVVPTIGISQQLFPKGAAATGKSTSGAHVGKMKQKGVEVEDVIETAYIAADMTRLLVEDAVVEWKLDEFIANKLKTDTDVKEFFPVQTAVIPVLLRMNSLACICPRDVCVAAPTGSGNNNNELC